MRAERRLDLAELDAEAADLDLAVGAAEEVEHAVGAPAHQVAGAVQPLRRARRVIGHEALGVELGAREVAARHAAAADVELADDAGRHRRRRARSST